MSFKTAPSGYNKPSNVTKIEVKSNNENTLVIKLDNKFKFTIKYRDNNENPIIAKIGDESINNENDEESIYLPIGTYWLSMRNPPDGYNNLSDKLKFEVTSNGSNEIVVHLSRGSMLPFT